MSLEPRKQYNRYEDMSPDGRLSLIMEDDGDIIITIFQNNPPGLATVQFCTGIGGGQSFNTRLALIELAKAIEKDNSIQPQDRELGFLRKYQAEFISEQER